MFRSVILARRLRCAATPLLHSVVGAAAAVGRRIEIRASTLSLSKIPTSFLSLAFALTPRVDSLRVGRRMTQQQHQYAQAPQFWLNQQQPYGAAPALAAPVPGGADEVRSLWIGDLQNWMDENYLTYCFYYTGQLVSTKIIRNKQTGVSEGYGFLEFTSRAVAESVLHMYNGTLMPFSEQSFFRLNWARGTRDKPTDNSPEHTIFVGGLAPDVTDYVLLETFKQGYKSVKGAKVITDRVTGYSKRFGFVKFADEKEQQRAIKEMDGVVCSTRKMRVGPVTNKRPMSAAPTQTTAVPGGMAQPALGKYQQQTPQQEQQPPQQRKWMQWQLLQPVPGRIDEPDDLSYYEWFGNHEDFIDDNYITNYGAAPANAALVPGRIDEDQSPDDWPFSGSVYLWIGNLEPSMDDTYLTNFFNNCGIVSAKVFRNEYGLLEFSSSYAATAAMLLVLSMPNCEPFYLEWADCEIEEHPRFFQMEKTKKKKKFKAYVERQPLDVKVYKNYFRMQGESDPNNTTIFVGDLDPSVTDIDLKQVFSQVGELVRVKILVPRRLGFVVQLPVTKCFGFVEFADRSSAKKALSNLNATMLGGRNIRLSWGLVPSNAIICVESKDPRLTDDYLKQLFSQYGEVVRVNNIHVTETIGHVQFAKWSCADKAFSTLNGSMLGGQVFHLRRGISSDAYIRFRGHLDPSVTVDHLKQVFSPYGELVSVSKCGWVKFANRTCAEQAFAEQAFSSIKQTMLGGTWVLAPLNDTILLDDLDPSVTVENLKQVFSEFGELVEVETTNFCMKNGLVQFAKRSSAEQALSALRVEPKLGEDSFIVRFLDYPSSKRIWCLFWGIGEQD